MKRNLHLHNIYRGQVVLIVPSFLLHLATITSGGKMSEKINKSYKFRAYPTEEQAILMSKTFGCVRYVYNHYLELRIELYKTENKYFPFFDCSKDLTKLKNEHDWLKEVDKWALQNSLRDLDNAYQLFLKKYNSFPKFKDKKDRNVSYRTTYSNKNISFKNGYIKLPKLSYVKVKGWNEIQGRILNATISREPSGKYYIILCCEEDKPKDMPKTGNIIGLDLGLQDYLATSNADKIQNPRHAKQSRVKIKKLQQSLSRKVEGSSNWNKARLKLSREYDRIACRRKDFINKLSTSLVKENDIICIEDLHIKGLLKNHSVAGSINDASWASFVRMLEYKAKWYGKEIRRDDRWEPSSQKCNSCGCINKELKNLKIRSWICPCCGIENDRDVNAAKNIMSSCISSI